MNSEIFLCHSGNSTYFITSSCLQCDHVNGFNSLERKRLNRDNAIGEPVSIFYLQVVLVPPILLTACA